MSDGPGTYKYITESHYGPVGTHMLHEPGVDPRADHFRGLHLAQKKAAAASAALPLRLLSRSRGAFHRPHADEPSAKLTDPPIPAPAADIPEPDPDVRPGASRGEAAAPRHRREYVPARWFLFRFLFGARVTLRVVAREASAAQIR